MARSLLPTSHSSERQGLQNKGIGRIQGESRPIPLPPPAFQGAGEVCHRVRRASLFTGGERGNLHGAQNVRWSRTLLQ
jgi:hypothetical protein